MNFSTASMLSTCILPSDAGTPQLLYDSAVSLIEEASKLEDHQMAALRINEASDCIAVIKHTYPQSAEATGLAEGTLTLSGFTERELSSLADRLELLSLATWDPLSCAEALLSTIDDPFRQYAMKVSVAAARPRDPMNGLRSRLIEDIREEVFSRLSSSGSTEPWHLLIETLCLLIPAQQTIQLLSLVTDEAVRDSICVRCIKNLMTRGACPQAQSIASAIGTQRVRDSYTQMLARDLVKQERLFDAFETALRIPDTEVRDDTLKEIALVMAGSSLFAWASHVAQSISALTGTFTVYERIVRVLSENGLSSRSLQVLMDMREQAADVQDRPLRSQLMRLVCRACASSGRSRQAQELLPLIDDGEGQLDCLKSIADAHIFQGDIDLGVTIYHDIIEKASSSGFLSFRDWCLDDLVKLLIEHRDTHQALNEVENVFTISSSVALQIRVARQFIRRGAFLDASLLLFSAETTASGLIQTEERIASLCDIAHGLLAMGRIDDALRILYLVKCDNASDHVSDAGCATQQIRKAFHGSEEEGAGPVNHLVRAIARSMIQDRRVTEALALAFSQGNIFLLIETLIETATFHHREESPVSPGEEAFFQNLLRIILPVASIFEEVRGRKRSGHRGRRTR